LRLLRFLKGRRHTEKARAWPDAKALSTFRHPRLLQRRRSCSKDEDPIAHLCFSHQNPRWRQSCSSSNNSRNSNSRNSNNSRYIRRSSWSSNRAFPSYRPRLRRPRRHGRRKPKRLRCRRCCTALSTITRPLARTNFRCAPARFSTSRASATTAGVSAPIPLPAPSALFPETTWRRWGRKTRRRRRRGHTSSTTTPTFIRYLRKMNNNLHDSSKITSDEFLLLSFAIH